MPRPNELAAPALILAAVTAVTTAPGCSKRSEAVPGPHADVSAIPQAKGVAPAAAVPSASADAVTHASPAYDAGPPVLTSATVDGAELRKQHIARLKSDRSPVTVLQGDGALALGQRLCEAVVPARPANTPILVKPNVCGFDMFKNTAKSGGDDGVKGRVTEPEFVRGVLRCLKARGHTRITVADGCGNSHGHWQRATEVSGFDAMAREEQVPLVAMDDDGVFDVQGDTPGKPLSITGIEKTRVPTLLMPKILAETLQHGLFISVPKMKTHRYAVVSLGIKGMQGTVMRSDASPAYNQKWRMHEELKEYLRARKNDEPEDRDQYVNSLRLFAERMVDVLEISLPDVVLAEGTPAMLGDGFQNLRILPGAYVAIGGTNPVLVDRVGAEYLGLWDNAELARELGGHRTSPLITIAAKRYGIDLAAPKLAGDGADKVHQPHRTFFKAIAPFTLDVVAPAKLEEPTEPRPSATAVRTAKPPVLDGIADAAWNAAPKASWNTDYAGKASGISTSARFLWEPGALYVLFELSQAGLHVDRSFPVDRERPKLFEEDCVELLLTPDASRRDHYYEVELGPFGHFLDIDVNHAASKYTTEWSSGVHVVTSTDPGAHTAIIEARIDSKDVTSALVPGARLPLALYRTEGTPPRAYLAWSPPRTKKPNFHVPAAFGTLTIE